jgi:hypothetical protein
MNSWKFPTKEDWLLAWQAAHSVYAEHVDPSDELLCQALLWQAKAICMKPSDKS